MRITRTLVIRIITRIVVGLMARETGGKVGESCKNAGRAGQKLILSAVSMAFVVGIRVEAVVMRC